MTRNITLLLAALVLAVPASGSAQSTAEQDRDRERERVEQEKERARDRAEAARERMQEARERSRERAERARERNQERRERELAGALDTVVAFDAHGTLTVTCTGGAVVVRGGAANELRVHARTENGAIRFSSSGTRATLEPSSGRGCSDGRFEVTVPVGTRLDATTNSGSLDIRGVRGEIEAHSYSGDVEIRDAGDRLSLETLSGDATVSGVQGEARINTISGDLHLTGARGDVEVETVSGDITLGDVSSRSVRTHTTSGDISFAGTIVNGGRYEFETHSGEIGLRLPPDVGAELTVSTYNGSIDSEFPITLKAGDHTIGMAQAKKLSFTLGMGTARIVAETFRGDITLASSRRP